MFNLSNILALDLSSCDPDNYSKFLKSNSISDSNIDSILEYINSDVKTLYIDKTTGDFIGVLYQDKEYPSFSKQFLLDMMDIKIERFEKFTKVCNTTDDVLDKISIYGIESLTNDELNLLNEF